MAEWEIEWRDNRYDYRCDKHGHVEMSLRDEDDFEIAGQGEAARAMLAELKRRGKEIEQQSEMIETQNEEIVRLDERMGKLMADAMPHFQLDDEAFGRGIIDKLLPGVRLGASDLVHLTEVFGAFIGRGIVDRVRIDRADVQRGLEIFGTAIGKAMRPAAP